MKTKQIGKKVFTGTNVVTSINEWLSHENVQVVNIETTKSASGGHMSEVSLQNKATIVWFIPLD